MIIIIIKNKNSNNNNNDDDNDETNINNDSKTFTDSLLRKWFKTDPSISVTGQLSLADV